MEGLIEETFLMYGVFFRSGDHVFVDAEEFATPDVKGWKALHDATAELAKLGAEVKLGGAPVGSWVLARFAAVSESTMFPGDFVRSDGELGGFRIRMLAVRGTEPVAVVRVVEELWKSSLIVRAADPESAAEAARAFLAVLSADPDVLGRCRVTVRANELGGDRNEYGYDGAGLLGTSNVRE